MAIEAGTSTYYQAKRAIVQDGLVFHLDAGVKESYSGGTTWRDLSGNGNNGNFLNGPTFSRSGKKPSISFDGSNDHIQVPSPSSKFAWTPSGDGMNYMTIDFWVKTTDGGGAIISKPWNGNGQYNILISHYRFQLYIGTYGIKDFSSMATGNWENTTCVANPTQMGVYRNGSLHGSFVDHNITDNSPPSPNNNRSLSLMTLYPYGAGSWNFTGHAINGNLSICRIYNKVLSADEVSRNYNATRHRFGL